MYSRDERQPELWHCREYASGASVALPSLGIAIVALPSLGIAIALDEVYANPLG